MVFGRIRETGSSLFGLAVEKAMEPGQPVVKSTRRLYHYTTKGVKHKVIERDGNDGKFIALGNHDSTKWFCFLIDETTNSVVHCCSEGDAHAAEAVLDELMDYNAGITNYIGHPNVPDMSVRFREMNPFEVKNVHAPFMYMEKRDG